jgi:putative membrane protein
VTQTHRYRAEVFDERADTPVSGTQVHVADVLIEDVAAGHGVDAATLVEAPPAPAPDLVSPPRNRWARRLGGLVAGAVALYAGIELTSAVQWAAGVHVALGWALGGLFAAVAGSALLAWREYRRVYGLLTGVETLRERFEALLSPAAGTGAGETPLALARELDALYRLTPLSPVLRAVLDELDASHSAQEVADALNRRFYAPLDARARALIQADAVRTGVFVASSPWASFDMLLVLWRNLVLIERVAGIYGIALSVPSRLLLGRHVLRNIAFAGATDAAIGTLSQSFLSGVLEKLAARAAQGVGIGLYSARIGQHALNLCRAVPAPEPGLLAGERRGVARQIRETLLGAAGDEPPRPTQGAS